MVADDVRQRSACQAVFVERVGRTTGLTWGEERAVCVSSKNEQHFTAARIAAFDVTSQDDQLALRSVVDFWWTPVASGVPTAVDLRDHDDPCARSAAPRTAGPRAQDVHAIRERFIGAAG